MLPNFRSMQGTFVKAYRGTSSKSDEAEGEKAVIDASERVCIHALALARRIEVLSIVDPVRVVLRISDPYAESFVLVA